jgi:hypothetical protein
MVFEDWEYAAAVDGGANPHAIALRPRYSKP